MVKLLEVASFERAIENKEYSAGCSLVQLSATKGEVVFLEKAGQVDSKYAVVIPNTKIMPKYLYYSLLANMEKFLTKYIQGLNLVLNDLKFMEIKWKRLDFQMYDVELMEALERAIKVEEKTLEYLKLLKAWLLEMMFC